MDTTAGKWHCRSYDDPIETPAPDKFKSEAWDSERVLTMAKGTINHLALTVRDLAASESGVLCACAGLPRL